MSFEFLFSFDGHAPLESIATRLAARNLIPHEMSDCGFVFKYPETPVEQVRRWGGDVELSVTPQGLLVTIQSADHRAIIAEIVTELERHGLVATVTEP